MKRLISVIALAMFGMSIASAQSVYTRQTDDVCLRQKADKWVKKGSWRKGFQKAMPSRTVNAVDFYEQYRKNPEQWKAMFRWLQETDLMALPKGKHPIPGTTMVASVEDSENGILEKRQSESHYKHIDFQWVVKGTERFGIIDHLSSKPNCDYKPDVIHYNYDLAKARFYDSAPDRFFLFFPDDWHIAKVATELPSQTIRVIVVKLDYL